MSASKADLAILDHLTDGEIDNLRTAIHQGDLDPMPFTWAVVLDSVRQMPEDVLAHYGDPDTLREALERVIAAEGADAEVLATYEMEA